MSPHGVKAHAASGTGTAGAVDLRAPGGRLLVLLCMVVLLAAPLAASAERRPESAKGTVIVPDRFLRRWDPVTVFLASDQGPAGGGPEDHPERFVTLSPPHPGAFAWLDARTLQFRPAEPWPPLSRFVWKAGPKTATLATLMVMPTASIP